MTMEARYIEELRDRDPSTVDVMYVDNSEGGVIGGINDKLTSLEVLSMVKCGLTSLANFPKLENLTVLDLSDNELGDNNMFGILSTNAPSLIRITLTGNKLTLESLRPLKMLQQLKELDLSNNENLGSEDEYRTKVFEMIPTLQILDGCDIDGKEVEEDGSAGESDNEEEDASDAEGPGLSYLNKSQFSDDDDDDYVPPEGNSTSRVFKRPASGDEEDGEPEAKKPSNDE